MRWSSTAPFCSDHPKAREVRLAYARLLVGEKQYHQARAEFQRVMDDAPNNPDIAFAIGLLAMQEGDFEAADTYLQQALGSGYKDSDLVRLYLGQVAEERKRWDEAAKWYDSVEQGEHYINAQIRHAGLLAKQGKLDEARQRLQQTQAQNNQQRAVLIQAEAQLLREAKMYQEAFDVLGKGTGKTAQPSRTAVRPCHGGGKTGQARCDGKGFAPPDPAQARQRPRLQCAGLHLCGARHPPSPKRATWWKKPRALAPEDPFIMDSLGWVYFRLGQHAKALEILRHALELRHDPEIAAHLGEVLWARDSTTKRATVWQSALKLAPESEALRNVMQKFK